MKSRSRGKGPLPDIRRLPADRHGSVAIIFGISFLCLMMAVGAAIDFYNIAKTRTFGQAALDEAALAASNAAAAILRSGGTVAAATTAGENTIRTYLAAGIGSRNVSIVSLNTGANVTSVTAAFNPTVTLQAPTYILQLAHLPFMQIALKAGAVSASAYVNVYVMVDISGSMLIGATQADMNTLSSKFGCIFACHDGSTNVWNGSYFGDVYQWATLNNVTTRYQVVQSGVSQLVNYMKGLDPSGSKFKMALYTFDQSLTVVSALSSNWSQIMNNYPAPAIDSNDTNGATWFNENISTVVTAIGNGGDGSSSTNPRKLLIIATDGVEDPGRQWTYQPWLQSQVRSFDVSFCNTLKANNVQVGIINTSYLPMSWDWGYNATLGQPGTIGATRRDDIAPYLQSCAGNLFISASSVSSIQSAFTSILQSSAVTRLVK